MNDINVPIDWLTNALHSNQSKLEGILGAAAGANPAKRLISAKVQEDYNKAKRLSSRTKRFVSFPIALLTLSHLDATDMILLVTLKGFNYFAKNNGGVSVAMSNQLDVQCLGWSKSLQKLKEMGLFSSYAESIKTSYHGDQLKLQYRFQDDWVDRLIKWNSAQKYPSTKLVMKVQPIKEGFLVAATSGDRPSLTARASSKEELLNIVSKWMSGVI